MNLSASAVDENTLPHAGSERLVWIDAAKGFTIVLVVLGHTLGGVLSRGWLDPSGPGRKVYDYLYLFHMPLFFLLSGLLLIESARTRPVAALVSRVGSIVWPYLLWDAAIRWALLPFIGRYMGAPPEPSTTGELLTRAVNGELSWFLWTLFLTQAILIGLARLPPLMLFAASVAVSVLSAGVPLGTIGYLIEFMPYLAAGATLRPYMDRLRVSGTPLQFAGALCVFAVMAAALVLGWTALRPVKIACGLAGALATIVLVQCLGHNFQNRVLAWLGTASLAIYVLHPYFQGAARTVLTQMAVTSPLLQVTVVTLAAVAGSFAVWWVTDRLGAKWLFRIQFLRPRHG